MTETKEKRVEVQIKVTTEKPPNFDAVVKHFSLTPDQTKSIVFTYGDTIYNAPDHGIADHLLVHETEHVRQQANLATKILGKNSGAKAWWKQVLGDPVFRYEQELEAYQAQYKYFCSKVKDRNTRTRFAWSLATDLAGPMYGKCVTHSVAFRAISSVVPR